MVEKKWLNKSQIQLFLQCPFKWKCVYIDKLPTTPSSAQERGTQIHKQIEEFYKNIELVKVNDKKCPVIVSKENINKEFLEFEKKRINGCLNKDGIFDEKYFKPIFQELKIENEELMLYGTMDAVYINPKDDGIIIIDWKSGKFYKDNLNDYRFELSVYKELLERSGKVDEVKYWGIYFIDQNKLFFEKIERKWIDRMFRIVNKVREEIEKEEFGPNPNIYCSCCEFQKECMK